MHEHLFLCGLDKEQRSRFADGKTLSLDETTGNLKLKLDQMRRTLVGNEPERLTDFLEISSYVFAADRNTSRGSAILKNMGEEWRRTFRLVIGVRDVAFWKRPEVKLALSDTLGFLSEDAWQFEFDINRNPCKLDEYLNFKLDDGHAAGATSIVLFSGGLDSLAGAVHELKTSNRHVVLVSHRNLNFVGKRQRLLAKKLAADFPKRVTHVYVDNHLTKLVDDNEDTQRTRSFFFTAIAAVAAHIETSDRIRFYENGVMSVNLPIATQVVGARSSRSTHPRSLQLLQNIVGLISKHAITVENPFIWKTKVEVVRELHATKQSPLIRISLSCSRSRFGNKKHQPHCGRCVQCLHRRISTLGGGAADIDEAEGYETDLFSDAREDGDDRVMSVGTIQLALDCTALSESGFFSRFSDEFGKVMQAYPQTEHEGIAKKLIDLFRRYGKCVFGIVSNAIKGHSDDITAKALAPSSLLALLLANNFAHSSARQAPELGKLPEPSENHPPSDDGKQSDQVYIAIDDAASRVHILGFGHLDGDAIVPILRRLIALRTADRLAQRASKNFACLSAKHLANELELSTDEAVRSAVRRVRKAFAENVKDLGGEAADPNGLIQTTEAGYRLNPAVEVVSLKEFMDL